VILEQMAEGALTTSEGQAIIGGIEALTRAFAVADLEQRVKALEENRIEQPGEPDREA
jgi:hypothetical protein